MILRSSILILMNFPLRKICSKKFIDDDDDDEDKDEDDQAKENEPNRLMNLISSFKTGKEMKFDPDKS